MVRPSPSTRLADVAAAGMQVFGRLGYRRTKMADVSAAAGLSTGAIYTYVDSKEALLHLVFAWFFGHYAENSTPDLPIVAPAFGDTLELVASGLKKQAATPLLRSALTSNEARDVGSELRQIVEEMYSMIERLWPILAVIETCAVDLPELQKFYFDDRRPGQVRLLARYLEQRAGEGGLCDNGDAILTAQLAVEVITWHAWHRLEGFDAPRFADAGSRQVVVDFVCNALEHR